MFGVYTGISRANQKVVVINPGHSIGYDPGASGTSKSEAQVNQELAGRVVRNLVAKGYKVYITHTTDTELAPYKLLDQEAGSSLASCGKAANSVNPDLVMSLHHNSGGATSSGYELYWSSYRSFDSNGVYTYPNLWPGGGEGYRDSSPCGVAVQSQQFANIVKNHLEGIPKLSFRFIKERDDYMPAHVNAPCILYEGGYLSNKSEADYLASDAYQDEASRRITEAIDEFLGGSGGTSQPGNPNSSITTNNDSNPPTIDQVYASATETSASEYSIECHATDDTGVTNVRMATWTEAGGQDDLVWKEATSNGNGNYSTVISVNDHNNESGVYITHVYAYDSTGKFIGVAAPNVTIKAVSNLSTGITVEKVSSNQAIAYANKLGGNGYKFAIWSEQGGQDDLIWADGEKQIDACYRTVINRSDHNNDPGTYFVHCYTSDNQFVGANDVDFGHITHQGASASCNGNQLHAEVKGIQSPDGIQETDFAVWSDENGQDDLKWYQGQLSGDTYSININTNAHSGNGNYTVHIYLKDNYGNMQIVAITNTIVNNNSSTPAQSSPAVTGNAQVSIGAAQNNVVRVTISNIDAQGKNVIIPVWSEVNGQDDLVWHTAGSSGANTYVADIDLTQHSGTGVYNIHIYLQDANDNLTGIGTYTTNVTQEPSTFKPVDVNTPIMGSTSVSAAQLSNMYNAHSPIAFPNYYEARGVSLGQFCQMYLDEARAEGVRGDIAFAQAMLETGFLNFGGDVSISQFNFAGLGATGGGVAGENFAAQHGDNANGIRMGIRAQIQHLKAYASTDPLNQPCVDNRFQYVTRGRATTIAGLAGTWAADTTYAPKIVNIVNYIK